jgi:hypothetical protein
VGPFLVIHGTPPYIADIRQRRNPMTYHPNPARRAGDTALPMSALRLCREVNR